MKWQYFSHNVPSVVSVPLMNARGESVTISDFREQSNLVLLFSHGLGCQHCQQLVEQLALRSQELRFADAQVLIVQPSGAIEQVTLLPPLHLVWDHEGAAWRRFSGLLEQSVAQDALLVVILDRYGAPQAACSVFHGDERNLVAEILEHLTFIAIQCPE